MWDDAKRDGLAAADRDGLTYVHPFADPGVDTVLAAIGGGGLISRIALDVKALHPAARVIGVEPGGAPTLHESVRAGRLIELDGIRTAATTLAPRRSKPIVFDVIRRAVAGIVVVEDDDMRAPPAGSGRSWASPPS